MINISSVCNLIVVCERNQSVILIIQVDDEPVLRNPLLRSTLRIDLLSSTSVNDRLEPTSPSCGRSTIQSERILIAPNEFVGQVVVEDTLQVLVGLVEDETVVVLSLDSSIPSQSGSSVATEMYIERLSIGMKSVPSRLTA